MKFISHLMLLFCLMLVLTACKNENPSTSILSVGKSIGNGEIQFKNTDDNKKISIINAVFNEKKWGINRDFDVRGKGPDLFLEINNNNKAFPALSVMIYFNDNGADVINFKAEHTVLSKEEVEKVKEASRIQPYFK